MGTLAAVRAFWLAMLAAIAACAGTPVLVMPASECRIDELDAVARPRFMAGREALLAGRAADALAVFTQLHQADPRHMPCSLWMQDAQREVARQTGRAADPAGWWFEARQREDVRPWLLAARASNDAASEEEALSRAAAVPSPPPEDAVWLHYAFGCRAARAGAYDEARAEAVKARAIDAGHSWAFWLEAWVAARHGSQSQGAARLRGWLDSAREDVRIDPARVAAAELDLALLSLASSDAQEARKWLSLVDPWKVDLLRLETAKAVVADAGGDPQDALEAARAAANHAPNELLPLVQQAILLEGPLHDPAGAEALWLRVYASKHASSDLLELLRACRARISYERLAALRTKGGAP